MKIMKEGLDKWMLICSLLLFVFLIYRLINQFAIVEIFPIDNVANDHSAHMSKLYILNAYGLNGFVPNWYGGFIPFKVYPPGWQIFALPIYKFTNSVQVTTYFVLILSLVLGFVMLFFLSKIENFSTVKLISFFSLFFGNALAIGYFYRLGKYPELLGWVLFILFFSLVLYYKRENKSLYPYGILSIAIMMSLIFYIHLLVFILFSIFFISLFLYKNKLKERFYLILTVALIAFLTSFFWIPFLKILPTTSVGNFYPLQKLIISSKDTFYDRLTAFITPILFLFMFLLYIKSIKYNKKEVLFYLPIIILSLLIFSRIAVYIPFINRISVDSFNLLFIFFSVFLFLKTDFTNLSIFRMRIIKVLPLLLILFALISITSSLVITKPFQKYTYGVSNFLSLYPSINSNYLLLNTPADPHAFYAYGLVYYNLTSAGGWSPEDQSAKQKELIDLTYDDVKNSNCLSFSKHINELKVVEVLGYREDCMFMKLCGLGLKKEVKDFCIYMVK